MYIEKDYFGRKMLEFKFGERTAYLVCPDKSCAGKPWLLKTEYFWAFPEFEKDMLERGYHIAYIENATRWHHPDDDTMKHELSLLLQKEFGLNPKCIPIGMSCGGLQAIYYASSHPDDVAGMYLDAPVVNLLSCPGGLGKGRSFMDEFTAHTGMTVVDLISYRNHPLDNLEVIVDNNIPVFLVAGDSDLTVPYDENGALLYDFIKSRGGNIQAIIKEGGDHHPHGLADRTPLITWAESLYKEL
ncbi:MAG: prolyl oligopeptidase family serine peptidase [Acutalibacteraceae bacterium]|nr:prolyl oligopeptidase family serine peptidase [Acutalibacteraceae bacterium]